MSLLQIREFVEENTNEQAVGIDLGTTHSLVAVSEGDSVDYLSETQNPLIPSVVHYSKCGKRIVGNKAVNLLASAPKETIYSIKRLMGRTVEELKSENVNFPYQFVDSADAMPAINIHGLQYSPIEVSAEILKNLIQVARTKLGDVRKAVITVPAYFDEAQRQATLKAANLAGIEVLRLLNEPTSAAIAYGLENKSSGLCLVYDLGGGTFDVSLLKIEKGVFEVVAMGGLSHLGGDDFDQIVQDKVKTLYLSHSGEQLSRTQAKEIKEQLSSKPQVTIELGQQTVTITREMFEEWVQPLIDKTMRVVQEVLQHANMSASDVEDVLMVGGASRMPLVVKSLEGVFSGGNILQTLDPDRVVAMGAAIQASILAGNRQENHVLLDVTPLSLGIETMGGLVEKILMRNSKIPCQRTQTFTTYQDNQTGLSLHVVQGERELVKDCRSLARFELTDIPPMPQGMPRIDITFQMDADGLLSVSAIEKTSQKKAAIEVKPTFDLSSGDIGNMIIDSIESAEQDVKTRKLLQKCVEANQMKQTVETAFTESQALLDQEEITSVKSKIEALATAIAQKTSLKEVNDAIDALEAAAQPLMQKRLQWALDNTLTGKTITDVVERYD